MLILRSYFTQTIGVMLEMLPWGRATSLSLRTTAYLYRLSDDSSQRETSDGLINVA